jgi:hypothetical protein
MRHPLSGGAGPLLASKVGSFLASAEGFGAGGEEMDAAGAGLESSPEPLRDCVRGSAAARRAGMNFATPESRRERSTDTLHHLRDYRADNSELLAEEAAEKNHRPTTSEMLATTRKQSRGNAGTVERVESQKQASHSFHEPLGNLAKTGRDFTHSHSSGGEGGWKSGKPKAGFPLSHRPEYLISQRQKATAGGLSPSAQRGALRR